MPIGVPGSRQPAQRRSSADQSEAACQAPAFRAPAWTRMTAALLIAHRDWIAVFTNAATPARNALGSAGQASITIARSGSSWTV